MTEEELRHAAARLGEAAVRDLDGERVARIVLERLATEPMLPVRRIRPLVVRWSLAAAALAAALLLFMQLPTAPTAPTPPSSPTTVLHELDGLTVSELQVLLETLPPAADAAAHPEPASFDELDAKSLERLLRSLEG